MNYTYKLIATQTIGDQIFEADTIIRVEDGVFIPMNPANRDYQEFLAWLAEGNEPLPADSDGN